MIKRSFQLIATSMTVILLSVSCWASDNNAIGEDTANNTSSMRQAYSSITRWNEEIALRLTGLEQENAALNRTIGDLQQTIRRLQDQINPPRPLRAVFRNSHAQWIPYTTSGWNPVTFNHFEGDERLRGNLSTIEIPEEGLYSLFAHYCWHANGGPTAPYTAIALNSPDNIINYFVHHHLAPGYEASDGLHRVVRLNRGDKVMVSIQGSPNAEYFLGHFQFDIEKIH